MSDIDGGAAAPAEASPAPETQVAAPNPVSTEPEGHPQEPPKPVKSETPEKPPTAREALQKAAERVEKEAKQPEKAEVKVEQKAEPKQEATSEVKSEKPRDETGKFAAKEAAKEPSKDKPSFTASEPPARFSQDAKAEWATAPESVRREAERAIRELTEGHAKYREAAERDSKLSEFHEMAKQSGKELHGVVREYVNMETMLRQDLVGELDTICQRLGVSLKDVAAHVMGQSPDQNASAQDATIRELKQTIAALEQKVGKVSQTFQQQQETATLKEIEAFAAKPEHSRFDELAEDIAFFLKTRTNDLSEAYKLAERLNPAPAKLPDPAASSAPVIDLSAQTEKGQKSINGSPTHGSNPASQRPSSSIKESLKRAMAQAG